jgi:hypothetical protein
MSPQFRRLIDHFFRRFFDNDAAGSIGIGPLLALLAVPGAIMTITLFPKYSSLLRWFRQELIFDPHVQSMPDRYLFVTFSMTVTGLVTLIKWDSLFPDRRDFANLMPLPFGTFSILFAKVVALSAFVLAFAIDINLVSTFLFPPVVMENKGTLPELLHFMLAHILSVAAASIFTFCALLAVIGLLMTVLPYGVFRRSTRYMQFAGACALLVMFFSTASVPPALAAYDWLPSVWFLGLYYSLQNKATPLLATMSGYAQWALLLSVVSAAVAYILSYRVFLGSAAETPDIVNRTLRVPAWVFRLTDATFLRNAFERGTFRFVLKTLFRSDRHTVIISGSLGLGAALAMQSALNPARGSIPLFTVTMTMAYFLITGLRFTFAVPSELRANWLFQSAVSDSEPDPRAIARKLILVAVSILVILPSAVVCAVAFGPAIALMHVVFLAIVCSFLAGALLIGSRVIPFTCAIATSGVNFALPVAGYFIGYLVFAFGLSGLEMFLLQRPAALAIFVGIAVLAWLGLRHMREGTEGLVYEESPGAFALLRISE